MTEITMHQRRKYIVLTSLSLFLTALCKYPKKKIITESDNWFMVSALQRIVIAFLLNPVIFMAI